MSNKHFNRVNLAAVSIMEYIGHLYVGAEKSLRSQALISGCIFLVKQASIFKVGEIEEEVF